MTTFSHGHLVGGAPSRTYRSWQSMWTRCTNRKHKNWARYGARGITVSSRWATFERFLADMGERPEGTTLDRIDNNGNYEPSNCRWASSLTQVHNSSACKLTDDQAREIRATDLSRYGSRIALARRLGVSNSLIGKIANRTVRPHLDGDS